MEVIKKVMMRLATFITNQNIQLVMIDRLLGQLLSLIHHKEEIKCSGFQKFKNGSFLVNNFFQWM